MGSLGLEYGMSPCNRPILSGSFGSEGILCLALGYLLEERTLNKVVWTLIPFERYVCGSFMQQNHSNRVGAEKWKELCLWKWLTYYVCLVSFKGRWMSIRCVGSMLRFWSTTIFTTNHLAFMVLGCVILGGLIHLPSRPRWCFPILVLLVLVSKSWWFGGWLFFYCVDNVNGHNKLTVSFFKLFVCPPHHVELSFSSYSMGGRKLEVKHLVY